MILITTPTGDIGARVLRRVVEAGAGVRVLLRDPSKLPTELADRIDVVEGLHGDADAIAPALEGVEAVFWLPPGPPTAPGPTEAYVDFSRPFCEALPGSGVAHVVGVSALGRGWPEPAGHVTASVAMDDMIGATGVAYRALACASLMENLLRQTETIRATGMLHQPSPPDMPMAHVAKADVAAVAAQLLLDRDWTGVEDVPLHGPEDLTFDEIVSITSEVAGREIGYERMEMDAFHALLLKTGASPGMAASYVEMLTAKNEGMDTMHRRSTRHDTPTHFRDWFAAEMAPAIRDGGDEAA